MIKPDEQVQKWYALLNTNLAPFQFKLSQIAKINNFNWYKLKPILIRKNPCRKFLWKTVCIFFFFLECQICCSEFVQVVFKAWHSRSQTFALAHLGNNGAREGWWVQRFAWQHLPMVKHTLRERLASSAAAQLSCETWANEISLKIRVGRTHCMYDTFLGNKNGNVDETDDGDL